MQSVIDEDISPSDYHGQPKTVIHQNSRERAIVEMQLGHLFATVVGKISVVGVLAAHRQCL